MGFRRNWLTGKLEEFDSPHDGREIIYREEIPEHLQQRRVGSIWGRPKVSESIAIHPDQVNKFNEDIKRYGGGGRYLPDGRHECDSQGALNKELARRNLFDRDAGYGQHAGDNNSSPTPGV